MVAVETWAVSVAEEYFTLAEAARRAGYSSPTTLYAAAKEGRLKTLMGAGKPPYLTSQSWLNDYLATLRFNTQFRGRSKSDATGTSEK